MTPAEYLPFERGIKDGVWVYLKRLGIYLAVMAAALILCGLVAVWFIPRPEKPPAPVPVKEGYPFELITAVAIGAATAAVLVGKVFSATLQVRLSWYTLHVGSMLLAVIFSVTVASVLTHQFELVTPGLSALLVYLFDAIALFRDRHDGPERTRSRRNR
jgi:hypothetical protein